MKSIFKHKSIGFFALCLSTFTLLFVIFGRISPYGMFMNFMQDNNFLLEFFGILPVTTLLLSIYSFYRVNCSRKISISAFILSSLSGLFGGSTLVSFALGMCGIGLVIKYFFVKKVKSSLSYTIVAVVLGFILVFSLILGFWVYQYTFYHDGVDMFFDFVTSFSLIIASILLVYAFALIFVGIRDLKGKKKVGIFTIIVSVIILSGFLFFYWMITMPSIGPPLDRCQGPENLPCIEGGAYSNGELVFIIKNKLGYDTKILQDIITTEDCESNSLMSVSGMETFPVEVLQGVKVTMRINCGEQSDKYLKSNITIHYQSNNNSHTASYGITIKVNEDDPIPLSKDDYYFNFAQAKEDISFCNSINDMEKVRKCYGEFAQKTQNTTVCFLIDSETLKDRCLTQIATEKQNISICEKILHLTNKENCILEIAQITKNEALCDNLQSRSIRTNCYIVVAESKLSTSPCEKISEMNLRDECYLKVAIGKNDTQLCEKIIRGGLKYECLSALDTSLISTEICANIPDDYCNKIRPLLGKCNSDKAYIKSLCYMKLAATKKDLSMCRKIEVDTTTKDILMDECYAQVAVAKKDHSICEQIEDSEYTKRSCHRDVDRGKRLSIYS